MGADTPIRDFPARPVGAWQCRASPTPRHTQPPTPVSQPHSLRHSKAHKALPGSSKQRPRTCSPGTGPLSLLRPDKKGRGF